VISFRWRSPRGRSCASHPKSQGRNYECRTLATRGPTHFLKHGR
jgi:hypothetical protein